MLEQVMKKRMPDTAEAELCLEEADVLEEALLSLLKKSPQEGLKQAISLYGGGVKTICSNILGIQNSRDIDECISDIFVKLWKAAPHYRMEQHSSLKSYLYGIARHTAIDRRRQLARGAELLPMEENDLGFEVDFAQEASKKENQKLVYEVVTSLPPPDREIFIYRYYFYYKVEDISLKLGLSLKAVENKLFRGKAKIRERLLEKGVIL